MASVVRCHVGATSTKVQSSSVSMFGFGQDSGKTTLHKGMKNIKDIVSRMHLNGIYVNFAYWYFTMAVQKNFVQGRRTMHMIASERPKNWSSISFPKNK